MTGSNYITTPLQISLKGYHLSDDHLFSKNGHSPLLLSNHILTFSFLLQIKTGRIFLSTIKPLFPEEQNGNILYLLGTGNSWKYTGFDASSWKTGKSGFGYGDNDDSTVLNKIVSVFIRKEFKITNLSDIAEMVLSIDYDDGFIAYINGHEIARSNLGTGLTGSF